MKRLTILLIALAFAIGGFVGSVAIQPDTYATYMPWPNVVNSQTYYPNASETDQGATGNGRTIKAYVDAIGTDKKATIKLTHNNTGNTTTYQLSTSETIPSNITLEIEHGAILNNDISIRNADYKWTASGSGTSEYYLEAAAGGDPGISEPSDIFEDELSIRNTGYKWTASAVVKSGTVFYLEASAGGNPGIAAPNRVFEDGAGITESSLTETSINTASDEWAKSRNGTDEYFYGSIASIRNSSYQWTASGSGTDEYYLEASGGGDPSISEPGAVTEDGTCMAEGTVGSLAAGAWDYGDNDTLGYNTIYVRLTVGGDPDAQAEDFVQTVNNPSLSEPDGILENDSPMTYTASGVGSLTAGQWDWGDNDVLGFNTVYVRLSDSTDPDSKAAGYVETVTNNLAASQFDYCDHDGLGYSTIYIRIADSTDPDSKATDYVTINYGAMTVGTMGSLAAGEWDWGDNDTLGYNTVYVRTTNQDDPDDLLMDSFRAGYKITINGPFSAGLYQVFSGDGSVSFGDGAVVEVYPEWWGADTSSSDNTVAFQAAFDAGAAPVVVSNGVWKIANTLKIPESGQFTLRGLSKYSTKLQYTGTGVFIQKEGGGPNLFLLEEINLYTTNAVTALLDLRDISYAVVQRCNIQTTGGGDGVLLGTDSDSSINNVIRDCDITSSETTGTGIKAISITNALLLENNVINYFSVGVSLTDTENVLVKRNTFEHQGSTCVVISGSSTWNPNLESNYFEHFGDAAVSSSMPFRSASNDFHIVGKRLYDFNEQLMDALVLQETYHAVPNFPGANLSDGGNFENFTSDNIPVGWYSNLPANTTLTKDTTTVFSGTSSLKVVKTGTESFYLLQTSGYGGAVPSKAYMVAWVWCDTPDAVYLNLKDAGGSNNSAYPTYHPGDSKWHYLAAARTLSDSATYAQFFIKCDKAATFYIDSVTHSFGQKASLYWIPSPSDTVDKFIYDGIKKTMTGNEDFVVTGAAKVFIRDPGGANRNFNPDSSATFARGCQITVINTADAAETITFDSLGLNQAINQNERGIFVFDGDNWLKIYVGS